MTVRNGDEIGYLLNCQLCDWVARVTDWREGVNHAWTQHCGETIKDVFGPALVIQCDHFKCPNVITDTTAPNIFAVAVSQGWTLTADSDEAICLGPQDKITLSYEYCPLHS